MREQKQMYNVKLVCVCSSSTHIAHCLCLVSAPMGASSPKFLNLEQTNEQSAKTQTQNVAKQNEPIIAMHTWNQLRADQHRPHSNPQRSTSGSACPCACQDKYLFSLLVPEGKKYASGLICNVWQVVNNVPPLWKNWEPLSFPDLCPLSALGI